MTPAAGGGLCNLAFPRHLAAHHNVRVRLDRRLRQLAAVAQAVLLSNAAMHLPQTRRKRASLRRMCSRLGLEATTDSPYTTHDKYDLDTTDTLHKPTDDDGKQRHHSDGLIDK